MMDCSGSMATRSYASKAKPRGWRLSYEREVLILQQTHRANVAEPSIDAEEGRKEDG